MAERILFSVDRMHLEEHVKRICRSNLKRPAKICTQCPFLYPVMQIMDERGWKYNKEEMEKHIEKYGSSAAVKESYENHGCSHSIS